MRSKVFSFLFFCFIYHIHSQNKLDTYINLGLNNNEVIKQYNFDVNKSLWALKESKSLFYPEVTVKGNYTKADGGRTVDFPIGDLINPIYKSLNQITGSNAFPTLVNQSILLNPNNFYDIKIQTLMPLLNYEIVHNKRIKKQQNELQKIELEVYKRELIKDIKIAYYRFLQSQQVISIYENALKLTSENLRVNSSLLKNGKINRTAVLRSENEVKRIEANLMEAKANNKNARSYFNFLINRPLEAEIEIEQYSEEIPTLPLTQNINTREEISKLDKASEINKSLSDLTKSKWLPKLNAFLDLGYQDFNFKVREQSRYYFAGVALEWSIFSGNKNQFKLKQVEEEGKKIASQKDNVQQQLLLQFEVAKNNFLSKIQIYEAEKNQSELAEKFNGDISKLYKQGMAIYIELLDAQNQYINSLLSTNISFYDTWISFAELERANAGYNLKP